jgi:GNAT superfamily N-acetyltransferase
MNPTYTLRLATPEDAAIITHHRRRMFTDMGNKKYIESTDVDAAYEQWVQTKLAEQYYVGWLMTNGDAVIAGVGVELREHGPNPIGLSTRYAYVVNVYVEPDYRQQGIARQLMITMLEWCAQEELHTISLHASDKGRHLYESLGFVQTNEMRLMLP